MRRDHPRGVNMGRPISLPLGKGAERSEADEGAPVNVPPGAGDRKGRPYGFVRKFAKTRNHGPVWDRPLR